jgi:hypothetical protein
MIQGYTDKDRLQIHFPLFVNRLVWMSDRRISYHAFNKAIFTHGKKVESLSLLPFTLPLFPKTD